MGKHETQLSIDFQPHGDGFKIPISLRIEYHEIVQIQKFRNKGLSVVDCTWIVYKMYGVTLVEAKSLAEKILNFSLPAKSDGD